MRKSCSLAGIIDGASSCRQSEHHMHPSTALQGFPVKVKVTEQPLPHLTPLRTRRSFWNQIYGEGAELFEAAATSIIRSGNRLLLLKESHDVFKMSGLVVNFDLILYPHFSSWKQVRWKHFSFVHLVAEQVFTLTNRYSPETAKSSSSFSWNIRSEVY